LATVCAPAQSAQEAFTQKIVQAALERATHHVRYDGSYVKIAYPDGDVPADTGVCTDEVIRVFRMAGVDLQKEVHEDMVAHFSEYPHKWGRDRPDANIDHRRVPNLMKFFERRGDSLPITPTGADYKPGDVVAWDLGGGVTHIGIVVDRRTALGDHYFILHNIGQGPKIEDVLFSWKIIGHYRWRQPAASIAGK
jgi:uncharacterized protein YijF (DUF1287 family)